MKERGENGEGALEGRTSPRTTIASFLAVAARASPYMIGVVGPAGEIERLAEAIDGPAVATGTAESVLEADPALVVTVGEPALCAVVSDGVDVLVLPV